MSVKDEVIEILEKLERGGYVLEHVHIVEQATALPDRQGMTVYVTLPVDFSFSRESLPPQQTSD